MLIFCSDFLKSSLSCIERSHLPLRAGNEPCLWGVAASSPDGACAPPPAPSLPTRCRYSIPLHLMDDKAPGEGPERANPNLSARHHAFPLPISSASFLRMHAAIFSMSPPIGGHSDGSPPLLAAEISWGFGWHFQLFCSGTGR